MVIDHGIPCHNRCGVEEIVLLFVLATKKGRFRLIYSSSKKTIAVFDLHFSQLKSINVVSNVCKVKSFSSIFMRMAGD